MIRGIIEQLSDADRKLLMCAFEDDFSQEIPLADGTFIGMNVYVTDEIEVIEEINSWIHGRRK